MNYKRYNYNADHNQQNDHSNALPIPYDHASAKDKHNQHRHDYIDVHPVSDDTRKTFAGKTIDDDFFNAGARSVSDNDLKDLSNRSDEAIRKMRGPLATFLYAAKDLLSMIRDYIAGRYKDVPAWTIASAAFALLYVLNPIDLIPDVIPIIGLLDDAAVMALCLKLIANDLDKYRRWLANRNQLSSRPTTAKLSK